MPASKTTDSELLEKIIKSGNELNSELKNTLNSTLKDLLGKEVSHTGEIEYPLEPSIIEHLAKIEEKIHDDTDDYGLFKEDLNIPELWETLIRKSIKCLRFFDTREPFIECSDESKIPLAYGVDDLRKYFDNYTKFEKLLYGGAPYYRDHIIHVFRVWLLGLNALLEKKHIYLDKIKINNDCNITAYEKICIWTIISLTHDLGYPLEKAQSILNHTKLMVEPFIINPNISMDLNFNGIQTNMNDFVVRFLSSKMDSSEKNGEQRFVARLQPKFYFKFQKSLEHNQHGILSCLILYKLLLYFLESDFSINEDYGFNKEETRQFYIRREILRSIASHTCEDIYHLDAFSFSFLLIVTDDAQDWGRKGIENLYSKSKTNYTFNAIIFDLINQDESKGEQVTEEHSEKKVNNVQVDEEYEIDSDDTNSIEKVLSGAIRFYNAKKKIFRDGQDTINRNFSFKKCTAIKLTGGTCPQLDILIDIPKETSSSLTVTFTSKDFKTDKENLEKKLDDLFSKEYSEKSDEKKIVYKYKEI